MSSITDAVIFVPYARREVHDAILAAEFAAGLGGAIRSRFRRLDTDGAGGSKVLTMTLYAASFNHVPCHELEEWWATLPLGRHDHALLAAETEGETYLLLPHGWGGMPQVLGLPAADRRAGSGP